MKDAPFFDFAKICPEAVFIPEYPQTFKFDLEIDNKNYGWIEIEIREKLDIYEIRGEKTALLKFEKMAREAEGKTFIFPRFPFTERFFSYPVKDAVSLSEVLMRDEKFKRNKDFLVFADFICNVLNPLNTDILYEKTGIFMTD